ncbi:hypothetical protein K8I61_08175 [bacterium]|nr:hypothetical protein [bacterium]
MDREIFPNEQEIAQMQVLIMKLASGVLTQNFTREEWELITRIRGSRETILRILHEELAQVAKANTRGRDKIKNLTRMIEKICG